MEAIKKHAFKIQVGSAIVAILFVITSVWGFAGMKSDYDQQFITLTNQYNHCNKWYVSLESQVDDLDEQANGRDVVLAEIRTQLTSMQITLQEIKQAVK
jgi:predicted nucleotidyltransferase